MRGVVAFLSNIKFLLFTGAETNLDWKSRGPVPTYPLVAGADQEGTKSLFAPRIVGGKFGKISRAGCLGIRGQRWIFSCCCQRIVIDFDY